jgi:tRNA U34 5-methylaminomethyl-2-thiouridine-forming methyltransferase MnmC
MDAHATHSDLSIQLTRDGSHTLFHSELNETFHSKHGAIQESQHVYIEHGLKYIASILDREITIRILEIGFGTGLNALLSVLAIQNSPIHVHYTTLEPFPITDVSLIESLNYPEQLGGNSFNIWKELHQAAWEQEIAISPHFTLLKKKSALLDTHFTSPFHLIYFDAFAPNRQPEMWTVENFVHLALYMCPNAALVTYCAQGHFKRTIKAAGYTIQRLPGPKYKKEMIRAIRPDSL